MDGEDWSDVVGHAYRRLDGRLALFPWQNRPDATQLDIALTYVVRLLADMLDKRSAYSEPVKNSLHCPCDPPSHIMNDARFGAIVCLLHCERQQRKTWPKLLRGPLLHTYAGPTATLSNELNAGLFKGFSYRCNCIIGDLDGSASLCAL